MSDSPPRSSFSMLLRRSKSGELVGKGKKAQAHREAELERQRQAAANRQPPKLPEFANNSEQLSQSFGPDLRSESPEAPHAQNFGSPKSDYGRPSMEPSYSLTGSPPVPPLPNGGFDPYARTESMTHRGRYSYASSAISTINSPRRVRRRKDPTPLNILVIGSRAAGKTSFLEFLKTALALPPKKRSKRPEEDDFKMPTPASGNFIPHFLETEIDGERVGLTLWDSEGLEKNVVDLQLREMSAFLESKFEETFAEEMKVVRSPGVQDTHIHAAFLILDPAHLDRNIAAARNLSHNGFKRNGHGHDQSTPVTGALDEEVDMQLLRMLQGKTTVIPVISKADTVTSKHMSVLKKTVWDTLKQAGMDPLATLGLDEDNSSVTSSRIAEEDEEEENGSAEASDEPTHESDPTDDDINLPIQGAKGSPSKLAHHKRLSSHSILKHKAQEEAKAEESPFLPLSIISPDLYEPDVVGRKFPWGFADPYNEEHCDFQRLKEAVFSEWRAELREASREQWYEGWRTSKLKLKGMSHRR